MSGTIPRRFVLIGGASLLLGLGSGRDAQAQLLDNGVISAYLYGFGPYEFARSIQVMSGQIKGAGMVDAKAAGLQAPFLNQHYHITTLAGPELRDVTTPNNDTLYTTAVLELSQGPVEVRAPNSERRYMSLAFMDAFTDQFHFIGTRATNGRGGRFWILGPTDQTPPPPGVEIVRAPTNDVWMLGRTFVAGQDDLAAARRHQAKISVAPVYPERAPRTFRTKATDPSDGENFVTLVNELLGRSPIQGQAARAGTFSHWGIRPGMLDAWDDLGLTRRGLWRGVAARAERAISKRAAERESGVKGWIVPPGNLGAYGADDQTRAGVALIGFGALTIEEAVYFRAMTDSVAGDTLNGARRYQIRIPPEGLPVDAFWSVSMYAPDETGRFFFYENEIDRYAINSSSSALVRQPDGSVLLALQRERPSDPNVVWMPTPDGPFATFLRTYLPQAPLRTATPPLPLIEPVG